MTDTSPQIASAALEPATFDWNAPATRRRFAARHRADRRRQIYGLSAIALAVPLIAVLIGSPASTGSHSLAQTHVTFDVDRTSVVQGKSVSERVDRGGHG